LGDGRSPRIGFTNLCKEGADQPGQRQQKGPHRQLLKRILKIEYVKAVVKLEIKELKRLKSVANNIIKSARHPNKSLIKTPLCLSCFLKK
jgi:hypothetical protein